jgi:hypothetical protein
VTGQDCLKISQVDNVAALALHIAVYEIADLIDVLLVHVTANRVAYFLKENLLGGLRCNPSELFHRQGQEQCVTDFDFVSGQFPGFIDRKLCSGVGDVVNHDFGSGKLDSGISVPVNRNVLARPELFLAAARTASFIASMTSSRSIPCFLAKGNVLCNG